MGAKRRVLPHTKSGLADATFTDLFEIIVPNGGAASGYLEYTCEAIKVAGNHAFSTRGRVDFDFVAQAGVIVITAFAFNNWNGQADTPGGDTITVDWNVVDGGSNNAKMQVKITATLGSVTRRVYMVLNQTSFVAREIRLL